MREEEAIVLVLALVIVTGAALMMAAIVNRRKIREMDHRERLAMIERGLVPSPESDPARFEASMASAPVVESAVATRYRTAGVLLIGFGIGLWLLITFTAGEGAIGIGVGGAWAVLGAASLLNYSLLMKRSDARGTSVPPSWTPPPPRGPHEPPGNTAP